jgi:hypothetical protein
LIVRERIAQRRAKGHVIKNSFIRPRVKRSKAMETSQLVIRVIAAVGGGIGDCFSNV